MIDDATALRVSTPPFGRMTAVDKARTNALVEAAKRIAVGSVHPLETVAFLESEGFGDHDARLLGRPNLFILASGLRNAEAPEKEIDTVGASGADSSPDLQSLEIPLVTTPSSVARVRAERTPYRHLLRGIIYVLPAMALATLLPRSLTKAELVVLPLALIVSWAAAQGIAYIAYQQTGFGPGSEARFLRRAITASAATAGVVGLSLYATGILSLGSALAVAAQACLMTSTAALVINGRELYLAALLVPGAIAGGLRLASGDRSELGMIVAIVCLSLATITAWVVASRRMPAKLPEAISNPSLRHTATHALSGALLAILALWMPTAAGFDLTVAVGAAALVLFSGGAEYFLVALRHEGRADLTRHTDLRAFQRAVGARLQRAIVIYALMLAVGQFLARLLFQPGHHEILHATLVSLSMVTLGVIFFVQGVAISLYGVNRVVPLTFIATLALVATYLWSGPASVGLFLLVALPLLTASTLVAFTQSYVPSHHR